MVSYFVVFQLWRSKVLGEVMTVFYQGNLDVENENVRVELQFETRQSPETVRVIESFLGTPLWHGVARVSGVCSPLVVLKLRDAFRPVSVATIPLKKLER